MSPGPGEEMVTYGELIHNPQTVELLKSMGVGVAESHEQVGGRIVAIRSHGISPSERKKLEELGKEVVDATCPHVLRIHGIISEAVANGRKALILGDKDGHAEVIALKAVGGENAYVVDSMEDLSAVGDFERVTLVEES